MAGTHSHKVQAHAGARRVHQALAVALLLLGALTLWLLQRDVRDHIDVLRHWTRHAATLENTADEDWLELQVHASVLQQLPQLRQPEHATAHLPDHVRVLVARPPYLYSDITDAVDLAHDPQDPQQLRLLDPLALWLPVAAKLGLLLLWGAAWSGLRYLPWGRDQTRLNGSWADTALSAQRPGISAPAANELREPAEHHRGTRFWAALLTVATVVVGVGGVTQWQASPLGAVSVWLVVGALDLLVLHTLITTHTRRLRFDDAGIADGSFFQTRRVPWAAIASFTRTNVSQAAQDRYDRDFRSSTRKTGSRTRPPNAFYWIAKDGAGEELLRVAAELEGRPAFRVLLERIQAQRTQAF